MLAALENLDDKSARIVLSRASEEVLGPRFVEGPSVDVAPDLADRASRLVAGLRVQAKESGVRETEVHARVLEWISKEISRLVFSSANPLDSRARLGNLGRLPIGSYELRFSEKFEQRRNYWGVAKSHVEGAILHCDQAQHFNSKIEGPDGKPHASLFTKVIFTKGEQYTVLVHCLRLGYQLVVDAAVRVYHSDVHVSATSSPLEVLEKFLDIFGIDIEVSVESGATPSEHRRLFHDKVYTLAPHDALIIKQGAQTTRAENSAETTEEFELSVTYGIDDNRYVQMLTRHGVRAVALPGTAQSILWRKVEKVPRPASQ